MSGTNQPREDDVLRPMLATPPEDHKPLGAALMGQQPEREKPE